MKRAKLARAKEKCAKLARNHLNNVAGIFFKQDQYFSERGTVNPVIRVGYQ